MNYVNKFLCSTVVFREVKIEQFVNVNVNKNLGKKIIRDMLRTNVSMFYDLSEAILQSYLHLDLFQFLYRYPSMLCYTLKQAIFRDSIHVQFSHLIGHFQNKIMT